MHFNNKKEQSITFKIKAYTTFTINLYCGDRYFATSAKTRGSSGQCQSRALDGLALAFYNRYDRHHLKNMEDIPEYEIEAMCKTWLENVF